MALARKEVCIPGAKMAHAPVMTLFFLWRLHKEPRHGYSLMQDMNEIAISPCKPSTVYALLAKLEKSGLVRCHLDKRGPHMRKLYQTTEKGWGLLQSAKRRKVKGLWREFVKELLA